MVSSATLYGEIGIVLAAIFVILVGLYLLNRYMKRRGPELATHEGKAVLDDRAHNQIRLGRAAATRLAAQGIDVSEATRLLDRAETARAGGNSEMSLDLSSKAKDILAAARTGANPLSAAGPTPTASTKPSPTAASGGRASTGSRAPTPGGDVSGMPPTLNALGAANGPVGDGSAEAPVNRPPKNKMESHFQLSLAHDELDQSRSEKARAQGFREADALLTQAQAAYDRQDYTEALRLALKSRRALGTRVEALPVSPTMASPSAAATEPGTAGSQPTFGQKCAKCGRVAAASDQFCRGCGAPIAPAVCGNCGAPLLAGDRFCGKCGSVQT